MIKQRAPWILAKVKEYKTICPSNHPKFKLYLVAKNPLAVQRMLLETQSAYMNIVAKITRYTSILCYPEQ